MRLLITGGAGFIGSHFVRHILGKYPDYQVINLDKLTYAGRLDNLADCEANPRYTFIKGDIADPDVVEKAMKGVDMVAHLAAETHVDRSIESATPFIHSNVVGTQVLLDAAKKHGVRRFLHVSTDEVYGDRESGFFTEESALKPSSPYAASKAASDMLALAYRRTYGLPVVISRCSNNYGPRQYPEKLVPFFIKQLINGHNVPVYGTGANVRDWLHVQDHCRALDLILHKGTLGEIYNVSANEEHANLEITHRILTLLGFGEDRIDYVADRPGHDIRYAIDSFKIYNELGWRPAIPFEVGFRETVEWYKDHFCKELAAKTPSIDITINHPKLQALKQLKIDQ